MVKVLFSYNSYLSNCPKTHHLRCTWILWDRTSGRIPGAWLFFAPRYLMSGASAGNSAAEGNLVARDRKHIEASLLAGGRCWQATSAGAVGGRFTHSLCMWPGCLPQHGSLGTLGLLILQLGAPKASVPRKTGGKCLDFSDSASEVTQQFQGRGLGATF